MKINKLGIIESFIKQTAPPTPGIPSTPENSLNSGGIIDHVIAKGIKQGRQWVKALLIKEARFMQGTFMFSQITSWLTNKKIPQVGSGFLVQLDEKNKRITEISTFGTAIFKYGKSYVTIQAAYEEVNSRYSSNKEYKPCYKISFVGQRKKFIDFLKEIEKETKKCGEVFYIYTPEWRWWESNSIIKAKSLDSIILNEGIKEDLVSYINNFYAQQAWFNAHEIPYKRGILLYGPPGNGKTSLITALAHYFKKDIYWMPISNLRESEENLVALFSRVEKGSFIVFEDIDRLFIEKAPKQNPTTSGTEKAESAEEQEERKNLTLASLLNVLDGIVAIEDYVLFMTTNHIDKLDSALLRSGRIDKKVLLDDPTIESKLKLIKHLRVKPVDNLEMKESMSDFQERLIRKNSLEAELNE